jgi:hypothetical protein
MGRHQFKQQINSAQQLQKKQNLLRKSQLRIKTLYLLLTLTLAVQAQNKPSFFPIGIFSVPQNQLEHAKELGFNLVHTYLSEGTLEKDNASSPQKIQSYLTRCDSLGLKAWMGLPRYHIHNENSEVLTYYIQTLEKHPAIFAWNLFDEPLLQKISYKKIQKASKLLHKHDPLKRPRAIVLANLKGKKAFHQKNPQFHQSADIIITDYYPVQSNTSPLGNVYDEVLRARQLSKDKKTVWATIQLHGKGSGGKGYNLLEPSYKQIRNMVFQALIARTNGILFFSYKTSQFNLTKTTRGLENIKKITDELHRITPILLSPPLESSPIMKAPSPGVHSRDFYYQDVYHTFIVNTERSQRTLKIKLPDSLSANNYQSTRNYLSPKHHDLILKLKPEEVKILTFSKTKH